MKFLEKLGKELLIFDGAMGTMLQQHGLKSGELPENLNITSPKILLDIHKEYLKAGCDIVSTNTFGANGLKFSNVKEIVSAGVALARQAVVENGNKGYVALDLGPTGKLLEPFGDLPFEKAYSLYKEQVTAGVSAGADLILIETMGDLYEVKAAVLASRENSSLPVLLSLMFDENGLMLTGSDIKTAVITAEALGVDAIGVNCGLGPRQMLGLVPEILKYSSLPVFVQPNAGLPVCINGVTSYNVTPEEFAANILTNMRWLARMVPSIHRFNSRP